MSVSVYYTHKCDDNHIIGLVTSCLNQIKNNLWLKRTNQEKGNLYTIIDKYLQI